MIFFVSMCFCVCGVVGVVFYSNSNNKSIIFHKKIIVVDVDVDVHYMMSIIFKMTQEEDCSD